MKKLRSKLIPRRKMATLLSPKRRTQAKKTSLKARRRKKKPRRA